MESREFYARGTVGQWREFPEQGVRLLVEWSDGKRYTCRLVSLSPAEREREIRRAVKRLTDPKEKD